MEVEQSRFERMLSEDLQEKVKSIEEKVDPKPDDTEFHNPYLDAFEELYGVRKGFLPLHQSLRDGDNSEYVSYINAPVESTPPMSPECEAIKHWMGTRERWVQHYAWAFPTREVVEEISEYSPLVEIGAGTGYWKYLLEQVGADVEAFDKNVPDDLWADVQEGTSEVLEDESYDDRALFLCWPPYDSPLALDSLKAYGGSTIVYIGESAGGCNASQEFFELIDEGDWEQTKTLTIPVWEGVHDRVYIYQR